MLKTKQRSKWGVLEGEIDIALATKLWELRTFKFISRRFFHPTLHRNYRNYEM